jgi:hypothetical protein
MKTGHAIWAYIVPRHYRESGNAVFLVFPGFRLSRAVARSAGMTETYAADFSQRSHYLGRNVLWQKI